MILEPQDLLRSADLKHQAGGERHHETLYRIMMEMTYDIPVILELAVESEETLIT